MSATIPSDYSTDDILNALDAADSTANRDHYGGNRAERVADVQTHLLRGLVIGVLTLTNAVEQLNKTLNEVAP